jgi:spermidine synthase
MVNCKPVPEAGCLFLDQPSFDGAYGHAIAVERILFHKRTKYQEIHIVEAGLLGRMLILDSNINVCEFDEAAYHEMLTHVPLLSHERPERVLVIGGGDGGTVREVAKHNCVKKIDLCEIDGEVIEACRRFMPFVAQGFDDSRVKVHLADGAQFIKNAREDYDVIIVDGSDPDPGGPGEVLFQRSFFKDLKQALRPGGIIVSQVESFYLYEPMLRQMFEFLADLFPVAFYYLTLLPTYQSGLIGISFCSLEPNPLKLPDETRIKYLGDLKYYNAAMHRAAFALPQRCLTLLPARIAAIQGAI